MTNAKFRIKNGIEILETTVSGGTLTLVDGEIDSSQALLLDAAADITLDAHGGDLIFKKNTVEIGRFSESSSDFVVKSAVDNKHLLFKGVDATAEITALDLDMEAAGAATFNAGITLGGNITGPDNLDMVIAPQDENYIDIDGALKVTPAQAPHVNRTYSTTGGSSGSRTTLTATTSAFSGFPQSGFVKIQGLTAAEQPHAYTRTSDTILTSTDSNFGDVTGTTGAITLVPQPIKINGGAAPSSNTGQFSHDGGQITLDGGKWGTATNNFAIGAMYGSVILQGGTSVKKLTAADNAGGLIYKPDVHGGPNNMIPILHVGGDNQSMTIQEDYFTGQGKSISGGTSSTPSETVYYNFKVAADALAMMKVKSKVANVADADGDSRVGTAIVSESASGGSMNGMYFNVDDTGHSVYQNHGNGGSIGAVDYNFGVGHLYNGAVGTTQVFAMGYGSRSFNNGTSLANSSFTTGSSTFGAQGNSLATQNTFFQASITGGVAVGPAQAPTANVTLTVGKSGETNVGGVILIDQDSAAPSTTTNRLYNDDGNLYWGTTNLSASSASALNDLSDVTFGSSTLTVTSLNAFVFANDADNSISVAATTGTTAGKPLTISAGSTATASNDVNGGDLVLASGGGDGTGTSSIQFKTKVSGTDAAAERMRIHTDGNVGIGEAAPGTLLQLSGANAYLTLQNTTNENGEGGAETKIIFEDHANASLGQIEASHSGTSDDTKGKMILSTHNGTALTAALTITDAQRATFADNVTVTGDLAVSGNDLTFGHGASIVNTNANLLTINEATTAFTGDIQVTGNDIKSSTGATAITLSGANVTVAGNLTVSGTTVQQDVATLTVEDPLIELARSNNADTIDIGFIGKYNDGSNDLYAGLFRDANDSGIFKLFEDTQEDLSSATAVDTTSTGYTGATLDLGTLSINTSGTQDAIITSGSAAIAKVADGAIATIDEFAVSSYPATKYLILVEDEDTNEFMSTEILALGHSTDFAEITQYALLYSLAELGTFSVANSSGTIQLKYTAVDAGADTNGHKVRVVATRIATIA